MQLRLLYDFHLPLIKEELFNLKLRFAFAIKQAIKRIVLCTTFSRQKTTNIFCVYLIVPFGNDLVVRAASNAEIFP